MLFLEYKYIQIFVLKICSIQIYSDIHSVHNVASQYIRIFVRVHFMIFAHYWLVLSAVQFITVKCSAVQDCTVGYSSVWCNTVQYSAVQCSTVQYTFLLNTVQCTLYIVWSTVVRPLPTPLVCSSYWPTYSLFPLYTTLYAEQCKLHTKHCALNTVH